MPMDEETAARLRRVREDAELSKAEERMRSGAYWAPGPYTCLECGQGIRKPRMIKFKDPPGRHATLTWCSQECHDAWYAKVESAMKKAGHVTEWERYDQDGVLIGYVVPRRGFVPLEEIESAQDAGVDE